MNLLSYAFGILTVVAVVIAIVAIVGVVKAYKTSRGLKELDNRFCTEVDNIYRNTESQSKEAEDRLEEAVRNITSYIDSRIDKVLTKQ